MGHSEPMVYPRDCADRLLEEIRKHDEKDPPTSEHAERNDRNRNRYRPWPTLEHLRKLLDIALSASQESEEGGFRRVSVAYVPPRGVSELHYDIGRFVEPKEFTPRNIVKVAPAADPRRSYLGVWLSADKARLEIWGIIHSQKGPLRGAAEGDMSAYLPFDDFLSIRVRGPGVFLVNHYNRLHLAYVRGRAYWGLESARLQNILRDHARIEPTAARTLCDVVARMVELGKGGTLLITDPQRKVDPKVLEMGYRFAPPSDILKSVVEEQQKQGPSPNLSARLRMLADFVAGLTTVDGAIHLTSDLRIIGFGGKVMGALRRRAKLTKADPRALDEVREASLEKDYRGMRHRSAAQFCSNQKGQALAIVVSQDGDVTLVSRGVDGSVHKIGPFALGIGVAR